MIERSFIVEQQLTGVDSAKAHYLMMNDSLRGFQDFLEDVTEFSGLGDGLNIALKDLDIRGAGNLLGGEQSGFINELGFETYNKILDEALSDDEHNDKSFKRNEIKKLQTSINCLVDPYEKAVIPKTYIQNSDERLRVYGFVEEMSKKGSFKEIKRNLKDRFGPLPIEVKGLIKSMRIKKLGANLNIDKITCLLYTSPSPRDKRQSRMPSSA